MGDVVSTSNASSHRPQPGAVLRDSLYPPAHDVLMYPFMASKGDDPTQMSVLTDPLDKYLSEQELWETLKRWHRNPLPTSPNLVGMEVTEKVAPTPDRLVDTSRLTPRSEGRLTPRTPRVIREERRKREWMGEGEGDSNHSTVGIDYPFPSIVCKRIFSRHKLFRESLTPKLLPQNPVRILRTWFDDKHMLMIRMCCAADGTTQIRFREFFKIHSDPFIVEIWRIQKAGGRGANKHVTDSWETVFDHLISGDRTVPPQAFEETHDFKHWILEEQADAPLW